jgi:hypothetical protein
MSQYADYPKTNKLSVPERVAAYHRSSLEMIETGQDIVQLQNLIPKLVDEEYFEVVAGLKLAIEEFQKNPQLSLF